VRQPTSYACHTPEPQCIFEPFFTTKKDTGTGLGLWVSRELVEKHGGSMRVRSRTSVPLCGTIFTIFLPNQGKLEAIGSFSANNQPPAKSNSARQSDVRS
jgi:hypothetical protein